MNDQLPHVHGQEGTHYACAEMTAKYGGEVRCCECTGHKCREFSSNEINPIDDATEDR